MFCKYHERNIMFSRLYLLCDKNVKQIKELLQKKAMLLATNESLDNELREQKNIITNLSTHEAQNQVN